MSAKMLIKRLEGQAKTLGFVRHGRTRHWVWGGQEIITHLQIFESEIPGFGSFADAAFEVSACLDPADGIPPPIQRDRAAFGRDADHLPGWREAGQGSGFNKRLCPDKNVLTLCFDSDLGECFSPARFGNSPDRFTYIRRFTDAFFSSSAVNAAWVERYFNEFLFQLPVAIRNREQARLLLEDTDYLRSIFCKADRVRWYCGLPPDDSPHWSETTVDQKRQASAERVARLTRERARVYAWTPEFIPTDADAA